MNVNPKNILGGIPGLFEEFEFEKETMTVSNVVSGVFEDIFSLGEDIKGSETKSESNESQKFPSTGSIEFNKKQVEENAENEKQKAETERKEAFYQTLKEDQERVRRAKDILLFEEEVDDFVTNLPTDQKNQLLHYQASYRDRSIYQRAELRKKLIEERRKAEEKEKDAKVPSTAKQANAIETQFEGGTGKYGGGSANLSSASGAVG